jgi:DNA-binding response OmpR family regulator
MKLLIVEDDENTSSFMQFVLEEEHYTVRTAYSVGEARKVLETFIPDLVILDRGLPDEDGTALCRDVRNNPRLGHVPVLFLSARRSAEEVAEGMKSGGTDYMTKPFDLVELLTRVQTLLKKDMPPPPARV